MRPRAALLGLVLVLSGCSGHDDRRPAVYDLPARTVRPDETAVHAPPTASGELTFQVIGFTTGMTGLAGSHADRSPRGRYTRVRIVVVNTSRTDQAYDARNQKLLTADGAQYTRDLEATLIKRQPAEDLEIGAAMRVEMDLWYDIPATARPTALRVVGTAPLGSVTPTAPPADIRLP
ncbi:DUF4352 domain-containing protein [Actinomadura rayongensis]|uniref:DUF4352 domain-containing protein n=1 Tax=Actinomadura rayongensis TaxID=1429076 RepID=A0A6I4WBK8_9ACTN|nr:DUF4352 domain-containing protein [Actinomadura rayongensis]MXQ64122.1 DUF4352 domain-containing protein [Actinomadura rayongensis]